MAKAPAYEICCYRDTRLVHVMAADTRDDAELLGLEGLREGCEVTIYRHNRALRDWYRRVA